MKRIITALLSVMLLLSLLSGCSTPESQSTENGSAENGQTTAATEGVRAAEPTQSPEEEKALRILIIGNSHGNDTFWLLHEVFADQMPEQEVTLGALYYSGCSVTRHVQYATENQYVYDYHCNSNGTWETINETNMETALRHQAWDIILFQGGRGDTENEYNLKNRRALEQYVSERVAQPYKMMWQITWPSPEEPTFYDPGYRVQPPSGWVEYLQTDYGFDTFKQFEVMTGKATEYLLKDDTYEKVICSGAGIMHAHAALGVPQLDLWRDYTHLSDYGRLITAYCFYTQFTGNTVTEISLDKIPASLRHKYTRGEGDMIVTEEMKQVIIAAANHALEDPWTVPERP